MWKTICGKYSEKWIPFSRRPNSNCDFQKGNDDYKPSACTAQPVPALLLPRWFYYDVFFLKSSISGCLLSLVFTRLLKNWEGVVPPRAFHHRTEVSSMHCDVTGAHVQRKSVSRVEARGNMHGGVLAVEPHNERHPGARLSQRIQNVGPGKTYGCCVEAAHEAPGAAR